MVHYLDLAEGRIKEINGQFVEESTATIKLLLSDK